jgi:hypothetical protein
MIVTLTVKKLTPDFAWNSQFQCMSDFPHLECDAISREAAIDHVKGSVLHCLGGFEHPPDEVKFVYTY